jgi:hypothetical protein
MEKRADDDMSVSKPAGAGPMRGAKFTLPPQHLLRHIGGSSVGRNSSRRSSGRPSMNARVATLAAYRTYLGGKGTEAVEGLFEMPSFIQGWLVGWLNLGRTLQKAKQWTHTP